MKVHTIDLRFQSTPGIVAAFLVEGPRGLVLVETGPGSTLPALLDGIAALGFSPDQVGSVLVTHVHLDHAGAAGWWARQGALIHAHPRAVPHLVDPARLLESARMVYGEKMDPLWGEMLPVPEDRVRALEDGEQAELGGLVFTAWDTPGHARHHHCYAAEDAVFTGDAAGARLPGCDYLSVTSAPPQFDPEAWDRTLDRLLAAAPRRLFLTHFGEARDPEDHLARYRAEVQHAARMTRELLDQDMDADSLRVAYQAFQMERAFQAKLPPQRWQDYQLANPAGMCADGIRLYWEKKTAAQTAPG